MKRIFSTKIQNKHTKKKRRSVKEWRDWVSTSSFLKILYIFAQFLMFLLIVVFLFVFFFFLNGAVRRENKMKDILRGAGVETIIFCSGIM